jgi:hypothetical protein
MEQAQLHIASRLAGRGAIERLFLARCATIIAFGGADLSQRR